jgi:hypothetical protein
VSEALPLPRLAPWVFLVDHERPTLTVDHLAAWIGLESAERITDLHRFSPFCGSALEIPSFSLTGRIVSLFLAAPTCAKQGQNPRKCAGLSGALD